jgi:hypothetical protein
MTSLPPVLAAELRAKTDEFSLGAVHDTIATHATECLALVASGRDDYSTPGGTRFGGDPDLPADVAWPASGDPEDEETVFSNFIGQINLAELPRLASGSSLPEGGILYIFVRSLESASDPVVYDTIYHPEGADGLVRRSVPDPARLADEYLTDLNPVRVRAQSAVSIAWYRKELRAAVKGLGEDADRAFYKMDEALQRDGQIGQWLGFANAGDERVDLYRKMYLTRIGKTELHYNDYWDSLPEYEAAMADARSRGQGSFADTYEEMRPGVLWLLAHRDEIAAQVAEWRLLLRLDSNAPMNLEVLDADPLYVFARDADLAAAKFSDLPGQVTQG